MTALQTPSEVLRAARELITPEGAWTQGENARTNEGAEVIPTNPLAVCFCAEGALINISRDSRLSGPKNRKSWNFLQCAIGADRVYAWNDAPERTHAEVLAAFDAAIELAKADEARAAEGVR